MARPASSGRSGGLWKQPRRRSPPNVPFEEREFPHSFGSSIPSDRPGSHSYFMSGALLSALERKDTCSADRVARLVPDAAARYRAVIEGLPRANLPPDELSRARGLIHRFLGGRATVEQNGAGRVLARITLDGRPLFEASGPTVSNLVAGARFGSYLPPCPAEGGAAPGDRTCIAPRHCRFGSPIHVRLWVSGMSLCRTRSTAAQGRLLHGVRAWSAHGGGIGIIRSSIVCQYSSVQALARSSARSI